MDGSSEDGDADAARRRLATDGDHDDDDDFDELNEEDIVQIVPLDEISAGGDAAGGSVEDDDDMDGVDESGANAEGDDGEEAVDDVDDASLRLQAHSKDVFTVHTTETMVASGGEDDRALLWSLSDSPPAEPRLVVHGHNDSVTFVRFNSKGTLLASGDMSGKIVISDVIKQERVAEYEEVTDLEWLLWHHSADILFAGGGDGMIWMWLVANGQSKVFAGAGAPCVAGCLLPDGKRLAAGYGDGSVRIWTLKDGAHGNVSGPQGHGGPIVSIDAHPTLAIGASGAQDGSVAIFQTDSAKITSLLQLGPQTSNTAAASSEADDDAASENSVEALAFAPTQPWLATGTNDGSLTLWDLNAGVTRQSLQHPSGVVKCIWTDAHSLLSICLDGVTRLWDARDGHLIREWHGAGQEIFDVTFNPTKNLIVTGSRSGNVRFFQL